MKLLTLSMVLATCSIALGLHPRVGLADESVEMHCALRVMAAPTDFPLEAQKRDEHGVVRLLLSVDASGHALSAVTQNSSGSTRLDQAAHTSVLTSWLFDTSACSAAKFPLTKVVEIEYRRAPAVTLAGTHAPSHTRVLANARANPACFTRFDSTVRTGDFSIACVDKRAPAAASLAQSGAHALP